MDNYLELRSRKYTFLLAKCIHLTQKIIKFICLALEKLLVPNLLFLALRDRNFMVTFVSVSGSLCVSGAAAAGVLSRGGPFWEKAGTPSETQKQLAPIFMYILSLTTMIILALGRGRHMEDKIQGSR